MSEEDEMYFKLGAADALNGNKQAYADLQKMIETGKIDQTLINEFNENWQKRQDWIKPGGYIVN